MRLLQRSFKSPFEVLSPEQSIERGGTFGGNVGNLVFTEAAQKILGTPDTTVDLDRLRLRKGISAWINSEYDALVIPLANAFRPSFQRSLQDLTRIIRRLDVPVVVLGVGAQAGVDGDVTAMAAVEDDVRAFVAAVLDHGPTIGVRGEFTAEYLQGLGFADVEVIGCPSMFRYGPELPPTRTAPVTDDTRIAVNGAHALFAEQGFGRFVERLVDRFPETTFFGQNALEGLQLRWRDVSSDFGGLTDVPTHPEHPLYRAGRARLHVDPTTWIAALREVDYSVGGRIHGNIAAVLAGTPALVLTGDARTLELSRYFEIPHRLLRSLPEEVDPARLLEEADWAPMHAGHRARWERFAGYLRRHGLGNAFDDGDGGRAFEERLAALDFPPPITPSTLSDLEAARDQVAWLRAELATSERERRRAEWRRVRAAGATRADAPRTAAPRVEAPPRRTRGQGGLLRRMRRPRG
ncbi:polysaccharide pyruvyl transferase family protein [Nocardioides sp. R1-1]|uniref:polysaccharide pyruvyl transferase family protein n=1 Tax=Nocardioides sp. R1-1 TaxID=3383502 RepID=UPI0038CFB863